MKSLEAAVFEHAFFGDIGRHADRLVGSDDACWRMAVIKQRIVVGEAFGAEELLGVERSISFSELGVTLMGDLSQPMIVWHDVECSVCKK